MSNFGIGFLIASLAFAALEIFLGVQSFRKKNSLGNSIAVACFGCAVMVLSYLVAVFCDDAFAYSCCSSVFFISIDILAFAFFIFVRQFCEVGKPAGKCWICKLLFLLICFDTVIWILNPFYDVGVSFVHRATEISRFSYDMHLLYRIHLVYCYSIVAFAFFYLSRKTLQAPEGRKGRYLYTLLGLLAVIVVNVIVLFFPNLSIYSIVDVSIFGFCLISYVMYWGGFHAADGSVMLNHSIPLEKRMNILFIGTGIVGSICGLVTCLAASVHIVGIVAVSVMVVFMVLASLFVQKWNKSDVVLWFLLTGLILGMPVVWLFAGGINSGVNSWFIYELFYIAFALKGKKLVLSVATAIILDGITYYIGYAYPDKVETLFTVGDTYISTVGSVLVVGLTVVVTVYFQKKIYYDEQRNLHESVEEQERLRVEAERANNAKSDFLAGMSHEIRTPINAILGMDEMILRGGSTEEIMEYAKNIKQSGNVLLSLINDVLDFSKIESGKMDIIPVTYNTASAFNDLVTLITPRIKEKGLEFKTEISGSIPSSLVGDDVRLRQIVTNLLTNAVKYTHRGSITFSVNSRNEGDNVVVHVSVKDTGIGIREEDRSRLFESFRRLEETRNRSIEGSGLGLSITIRLLNLMGSSLKVESVYGQGSEFSFDVVQGVADRTPMGDLQARFEESLQKVDVYHEGFEAPDARILVVDDNRMNLKVIKGLLKYSKMQIDLVESGMECLAKVQDHRYDIIFMDHMMPQMDGIETLQTIREMKNNLSAAAKIVVLTANAMAGAKEMYLSAGFDDFLAKPIRGALLEKIILKYLPKEKILLKENGIAPEKKDVPSVEVSEKSEPLIDFKKGKSLCMDDEEFYREMLQALPEEQFHKILQDYFRKEDWKNYQIKVHALKSSLASIGADRTSAWAKKLELACKENNIDLVRAEHAGLMADLLLVMGEIRKYCC